MPAALRPAPLPRAVRPAIWALLAAATVAGAGVITGNRVATGLAYFGVACAAIFVTSGVYRTRAISLLSQGIGAAGGIMLGVAVADSVAARLAVAAAVAMLSGMIGSIGRATTAGALMAVIGLGFGEFARVRMPGWEQGAWYLVGTLVVAACALAGWPRYRDRAAWLAVAAVFDRAADLIQRAGGDQAAGGEGDGGGASRYRLALAEASAACRSEVFEHRLSARFATRGPGRKLAEAAALAERAAFAAATVPISGRVAPAGVIEGLRAAAAHCRERRTPLPPAAFSLPAPVARAVPPPSERLSAAVRVSTSRPALWAGLRLALCMTIATAVTGALHNESHSFWLPLTVAVAVRTEYGSVYVRTVNRVAGTLVGALLAAGAIAVLGSGWPVAVAAAVSLAFAVLEGPRLYGLSVIGVTCSALLSSCIGVADPVNPAVRLLDTLLGCAIAIVFGYLLWPVRKSLAAGRADLSDSAGAISSYLELAMRPPAERPGWGVARDRAYQLAHQTRRSAQAALLEPRAISTSAAAELPRALNLETLVDEVTAIANRVDSGGRPSDQEVSELTSRIQAAGRS